MKSLVIGTVIAAGSTLAFAGADAGVDVASAYIFRGATVSDEVSVQPTLNGSIDEGALAGLSVGTWANFNTDSSQFDEIDYYAEYALPVGEGPLSAAIGYTEYTYPTSTSDSLAADGTTTSSGTEADREVYLSLGFDAAEALALSAMVAVGLEGPFLDEGVYVELGAETGTALTDTIDGSASVAVGIEAGDNVANTGVSHATISLGASSGIFAASVNYVVETDDEVLVVDEDFFATVGVAIDL